MDNFSFFDVVQITRKDNPLINYQGKTLEKHKNWCKAIIMTERGNEIWDCHDDFWYIEYGVKIFEH